MNPEQNQKGNHGELTDLTPSEGKLIIKPSRHSHVKEKARENKGKKLSAGKRRIQ